MTTEGDPPHRSTTEVSGARVLALGVVVGVVVIAGLVFGFMRVGRKTADERVVITDGRVELASFAEKLVPCAEKGQLPEDSEAVYACIPALRTRSDVRWLRSPDFGELERDTLKTKLRVRIECRGAGPARNCRHGAVMDIEQ